MSDNAQTQKTKKAARIGLWFFVRHYKGIVNFCENRLRYIDPVFSIAELVEAHAFRCLSRKTSITFRDYLDFCGELTHRVSGNHQSTMRSISAGIERKEMYSEIVCWHIKTHRPMTESQRAPLEFSKLDHVKEMVALQTDLAFFTTKTPVSDLSITEMCQCCGRRIAYQKNTGRQRGNIKCLGNWTVCNTKKCRTLAMYLGYQRSKKPMAQQILERITKNENHDDKRRLAKHFVQNA